MLSLTINIPQNRILAGRALLEQIKKDMNKSQLKSMRYLLRENLCPGGPPLWRPVALTLFFRSEWTLSLPISAAAESA